MLPIDDEMDDLNRDDDLIPKDIRRPQRMLDVRRQADGELSDSDDEGEGGRRNHASHRMRRSRSRERSNSVGRKFGMPSVGILAAGPTAAHAGPSGQTTIARFLASSSTKMEADTPTSDATSSGDNENGAIPIEQIADDAMVAVKEG